MSISDYEDGPGAPSIIGGQSFDDMWAKTGYQYGPGALEQVKMGWELAARAAEKPLPKCPYCKDEFPDECRYC